MRFKFKHGGVSYQCDFDDNVALITPKDFDTQEVVDRFIDEKILPEYFVTEEYKTYALSLLLKGDFPKPKPVPHVAGRIY